ncbi:MAG: glycosyltransferase [Elusimicrobia bacterium]|nr:glycosyltransferase [Elusimicrobiota bacterium]
MPAPALSVVIPVRGRWLMTRDCLARLRRHTAARSEVLVVDGGSPAPMRRALAALARSWPSLRVLRLERPLPFAAAVNRGLKAARGDVLVLLNNDVSVTAGWDAALARVLAQPGVGAAGPRTCRPGPGLDRDATACALAGAGRTRSVRVLYAHCLALRREAVSAVGLLDERLVWGEEDDDYCFRLRQGGWRLAEAEDCLVGHTGGASRGRWSPGRRRAHARANAAVLREKWVGEAARIRRDLKAVLA